MRNDPEHEWLQRRTYPDLPKEAEIALRTAGLVFSDGDRAELHLRRAAAIAPDHEAVVVAHYRYYLYKHRFADAIPYVRRCIARLSEKLGIEADPMQVMGVPTGEEATVRFYLFACQAYGYVLLRSGDLAAGEAVLRHLLQLDPDNASRTVQVLSAMQASDNEDD